MEKVQTKLEELELQALRYKGSVYDRLAQIEYHNNQINELRKQNDVINGKISETFKEIEQEKNNIARQKIVENGLNKINSPKEALAEQKP